MASTAHVSVAQVTDETAAQRVLEIDRELALEKELHRRTREDLAGVTVQQDEVLVELRARDLASRRVVGEVVSLPRQVQVPETSQWPMVANTQVRPSQAVPRRSDR